MMRQMNGENLQTAHYFFLAEKVSLSPGSVLFEARRRARLFPELIMVDW